MIFSQVFFGLDLSVKCYINDNYDLLYKVYKR